MERGNIGNDPTPRIILIFEGALGDLPLESEKNFKKYVKRGDWDRAVMLFELNDLMIRKMWDIYWNRHLRVEVVTYLGSEFAESLSKRLEAEEVPTSKVWASEPALLARRSSYMPDLSRIYDADPNRWATYGSKGKIIKNVNDFGS